MLCRPPSAPCFDPTLGPHPLRTWGRTRGLEVLRPPREGVRPRPPQGLGPPEVPSGAGLPGTRPPEAWARKGTDFDPVLLPRARARYVSRSTFGPSGVQIWTWSYRPNSVISGSSNGPPYFTPFRALRTGRGCLNPTCPKED